MMDKLEKLEKVVEMCGVSFEDAREALRESGWDVIDAVITLEKQGKTAARSANFTTDAPQEQQSSPEMARAQDDYAKATETLNFSAIFDRIKQGFFYIVHACGKVSFVVTRRDTRIMSVPLIVFLILLVFCFWVTIPLLVIGLFFEFKYRFEGIGAVTFDVNELSSKVGDAAMNLRKDFMDGHDNLRDNSSDETRRD